MNITQGELERIIEAVMANVLPEQAASLPRQGASIYDHAEKAPGKAAISGQMGVYEDIETAIDRAWEAQKVYVRDFSVEDRKRIIAKIREAMMVQRDALARLALEETGIGRFEDKLAKIELAALHTPGVELLETTAKSGDCGLTIEEMAPFGLIGAVSPVTNPMETIINNGISLLAAGNSAVFNVHPSSRRVCAYTVDILNKAVKEAGGPADLVTMVAEPTMETLEAILRSPKVRLLLGTGGPGLVKKLLSSGKKAIGAAAGNPPVIVDETADIALAAREIVKGAAFDNNLLCIAEKEVFVVDSVADDLLLALLKEGAMALSAAQANKVTELALEKDEKGGWHTRKEWIGQDAAKFLREIGAPDESAKLLIFEADASHPFVQLEQMMPVLPIVRAGSVAEAIEMAVRAEQGNRHTASMFSRNVDNLTAFARAVDTTIFVKNAATLAGVGFGGEGYTTFTIAGATGEGLTCARTFTRRRRCVLAEGGFRIL